MPAMTIGGGGNRNAKNLPMGPEGREWSNGLCDCCNEPGTCQSNSVCATSLASNDTDHDRTFPSTRLGILAWCCPCVVYAQNKRRYEHLNAQGTPDPEHGGGCCSGDCCLHAVITGLFGAGWILQVKMTFLRYFYVFVTWKDADGLFLVHATWKCTREI